MELTRKQVIDNLSSMMDSMPDDACGEWRDSLAYAISSLKTDEMYQLDYEGVHNIVITEGMTNGDLIKMMFPNATYYENQYRTVVMDNSIGEVMHFASQFDLDWWNSPYKEKNEK